MRERTFLGRQLLACVFLLAGSGACSGARPAPGAEAGSGVERRSERMAWWREARFGLFVHWGLYAIPAGRWGEALDHGEWIRDSARIPLAEYETLRPRFDPQGFDADEWVSLARAAGMGYLVITSKHHDGFALYDSAETEWDVMGTPFRRDVLAELAAACERGGVRFCTYHSIMDWHHPDYLPRRPWEAADRPAAGADFERFEHYLHAQVRELVTRYDPGVLWFDGEWESTWTHARGVELYGLCRALDPDLIVNNRVDVHRGGMAGLSTSDEAVGDFGTPEQEIPATGLPGVDWETCMTMNDHWGWNESDRNWKSVETLVRNLIDVVSKGGNYLLNVGPKPDGTFPDEAIERLRGIGAWMAKHGDAIHGTSASPFEALPWGRCTAQRNGASSMLYLHVFERPVDGRIVLPGLGSEPLSAGWLAGPRLGLPVRREGTDVVVELPASLPDPIASVVALRIAGEPIVYRAPEIVAEADIFVRPLEVRLASRSSALELRYTLDGSEPDANATAYSKPFPIERSCRVRARAFHAGRAVSTIAERSFRAAEPRPGQRLHFRHAGLALSEYSGDWDALPDFAAFTPTRGTVPWAADVSHAHASKAEHVGLLFDGYFQVESADVYTFALTSDDGSDLWIDGERVLDNDGLHGSVERRAQAALGPGYHAIRVRWFNKTGGAELDLRWAPLGGELAPIPAFMSP